MDPRPITPIVIRLLGAVRLAPRMEAGAIIGAAKTEPVNFKKRRREWGDWNMEEFVFKQSVESSKRFEASVRC